MLLNPGLAFRCVGVLRTGGGGSAVVWWWWVVLVFVSNILTFAFHHLVISGVSCCSCLWLDLVPQVFMLASISRPGRLALSWVSVFRVLSAGKHSLAVKVPRYLVFEPASWQKLWSTHRSLKIPWRFLCIPWGCPQIPCCLQTPCPRDPCAGGDQKGLVPLIRPGFLLP